MKSFVFPYYVSFGKNDGIDASVAVAISDKDAKRLIRSAQQGGRFRLDEDDEINDIYEKVSRRIIVHEKKMLLDDPQFMEDILDSSEKQDSIRQDQEELIDEYFENIMIGINYPEEYQFLEQTKPQKSKQREIKIVSLDRQKAEEYIKTTKNLYEIVCVDNGEVLFYVPAKYSGSLVISSSIKRIEPKAIREHKKITEIIIEDGLSEISDSLFQGCEALNRIVLPSSIKRIGFNAFAGCGELDTVELSEGIEEIDSTAFRHCLNLKELHFPTTLKCINAHINSYLAGIRHIYFKGMSTIIDDSRGRDLRSITIHAFVGSEAEKYAMEHKCVFVALYEE